MSTVPVELWCSTAQGDAWPLRTQSSARFETGAHTQQGPARPAISMTRY